MPPRRRVGRTKTVEHTHPNDARSIHRRENAQLLRGHLRTYHATDKPKSTTHKALVALHVEKHKEGTS